ncbi:Chaperone protein DnaK [Richelia intracellularis HM01]|nr:Chaperone protein DnaK [Richelia intracellularis HM01]
MKDLREAITREDDERIQKLTPELQQALFSIGSNMYQQDSSGADNTSNASTSSEVNGSKSSSEDVIDADFTESK